MQWIRFFENVSYEGTEYGPDYATAFVEVRDNLAQLFVLERRAAYASGPEPLQALVTRARARTHQQPARRLRARPLSAEYWYEPAHQQQQFEFDLRARYQFNRKAAHEALMERQRAESL